MMRALDQYGAALLGSAIRSLFPHVRYGGSFVDARGFTATFLDTPSFCKEHLLMLKHQMDRFHHCPFEVMEMLGSNAEEMLRHHGQVLPFSLPNSVFILKIGSIYEPCVEKPLRAGAIALLGFEQNANRVIIYGKAFESPLLKQQFLRLYRKWKDHRVIASQLELYDAQDIHPRGLLLKRLIEEQKDDFVSERGFLPLDTPDPLKYAFNKRIERFVCRGTYFALGKASWICALGMMQKWTETFGFEVQWSLGEKALKKGFKSILEDSQISYTIDPNQKEVELELRVRDFLGCHRQVATVRLLKNGICFSLVEDLDQWISLLLEKDQGILPKWLVPEQVRLIVEPDVEFTQVTKKLGKAKMRYTVDRGTGSLKEKISRALRVNVPYVMVFGKQEERTNQMTIRALGSRNGKTISLAELDKCILEFYFES